MSTRVWVPVTLWMVVIMPFSIFSFSWMTLTTGARQLVVHDAAVTIGISAVSFSANRIPPHKNDHLCCFAAGAGAPAAEPPRASCGGGRVHHR
jgi:hypothetical protein